MNSGISFSTFHSNLNSVNYFPRFDACWRESFPQHTSYTLAYFRVSQRCNVTRRVVCGSRVARQNLAQERTIGARISTRHFLKVRGAA